MGMVIKPDGHQATECTLKLNVTHKIRIGNLRTLKQKCEQEKIKKKLVRINIITLGISAMQWPRAGKMYLDEHGIIYSGGAEDVKEGLASFSISRLQKQ